MIEEKRYYFGVEEEFALVESDFALSNRALELLDFVPPPLRQTQVKTDLHYCIVETSTGICSGFGQARDELFELREIAEKAAAQINCKLLPVGVHPISLMEDARLVETDRYLRLIGGGALRGDGVHYGQHVHVNVEGSEERIRVVNRLRYYIPIIVAVSVNSPLYAGKHNGYKSVRMDFYEPVYSSGPPPLMRNWDDLDKLVERLSFSGVQELRDIYSDIRLRESLPTVEVRCIDTQPTVTQTLEVAALVYALVGKCHREAEADFVAPVSEPDLIANRRAAIEDGIDGSFVFDGREVPKTEILENLIDELLEAEPPGSEYLESLRERVSRGETGADIQLQYLRNDGLDNGALFAELIRLYSDRS
jgi:carboxylate-amine ligase